MNRSREVSTGFGGRLPGRSLVRTVLRAVDRSCAVLVMGCLVLSVMMVGCTQVFRGPKIWSQVDQIEYSQKAREIEYPNVSTEVDMTAAMVPEPRSLDDPADRPIEYWNLSLEETLRRALRESKVIRDMGGLVLRAPESMQTIQDPAIRETDPQAGMLAALSAFDPQLNSRLSTEKNDQPFNNIFAGGGTREFSQDFTELETEISKQTAMGSELAFRNITDFDSNNSPGNAFQSAYTTRFEAEARQRLLQGASPEFNRIAGPNGVPGINTGIVIARINTDISLTDFELRTRNFLSEVENAYWDLYFSYRDLEAKIRARDAALRTWRDLRAQKESGRIGGEYEPQAREQYYRLQMEVQNALTGRLVDGTRTHNGSAGGTFRANPGVYVAERRLRYLIGEPPTDNRLIRPSDEPITGKIAVDWEEAKTQALSKRVELRRQRWMIKRREAELRASRNYLLPQLDAVGRYRWRGFGKHLFTEGGDNFGNFNSAFQNLAEGSFQEWQLGLELSIPFGYRQANSAVRNAELQLARERTLLREQERAVVHALSETVSELRRSYATLEIAFNRYRSAAEQAVYSEEMYQNEQVPLNVVLEAQRTQASAEADFYRSLVDYSIAVKNVHFEKGTLLSFNHVYLEEDDWPGSQPTPMQHDFLLESTPWIGHSVTGFETQLAQEDSGQPVSVEDPQLQSLFAQDTNSLPPLSGHSQPSDYVLSDSQSSPGPVTSAPFSPEISPTGEQPAFGRDLPTDLHPPAGMNSPAFGWSIVEPVVEPTADSSADREMLEPLHPTNWSPQQAPDMTPAPPNSAGRSSGPGHSLTEPLSPQPSGRSHGTDHAQPWSGRSLPGHSQPARLPFGSGHSTFR